MKKLLSLLVILALTLSLCLSFVACGDEDGDTTGDTTADGGQSGGGANNGGTNGGQNGGQNGGTNGGQNGGQNGGTNGGDNNGGQGGGQSSATVPGLNIPAGTYNATAGFSGALVLVNNYMYSIRLSGGYRIVTEMTFTVSGSDIVVTAVRMYTPDANAPQDMKDALAETSADIAGQVQTAPYSVEGNTLTYSGATFAYASANVDPDAVALNAGGQGGGNPNPNPGGGQGGGSSSGATLANGKYYSAEDDGFYIIVDGAVITYVEVYDDFEFGYVYSYVIEGNTLNVTGTDVILVSGDLTPDLQETIDFEKPNFVGSTDTMEYAQISDGYRIGGEDFVRTKPNYGEGGGSASASLAEGTYYSDNDETYTLIIEGDRFIYRYQFDTESGLRIVYRFEIIDDKTLRATPEYATYDGVLTPELEATVNNLNANIPTDPYVFEYSVGSGRIVIDDEVFLVERPDYEGGGNNGDGGAEDMIGDGIYYFVHGDYYRIYVSGNTFTEATYYSDRGWVYVSFTYVIEGNTIIRTFTGANYEADDPGNAEAAADLADRVESAYIAYEGNPVSDGFSFTDDGFIYAGTEFTTEPPSIGGGGSDDGDDNEDYDPNYIKPGTYYNYNTVESVIVVEGEKVYYYVMMNASGGYMIEYDHIVVDSSIARMTAVDVIAVGDDPSEDILELVEMVKSFVMGGTDDWKLSYIDDGFMLAEQEFTTNAFNGGDDTITDGTYYSVKYDSRYMIISNGTITDVEDYGDFAIGYVYSYVIGGNMIRVTGVDVVIVSGESFPELEEELEAEKAGFIGEVIYADFSFISDGFSIEGDDYVATRPS